MGIRYTEELAAWADQKAEKRRRQDAAAVAFLAVKADVIEAMEAGYALTTIYEHMHETGRVKNSYETFRRHVQRFVKTASSLPTPPVPKAVNRSNNSSPSITPKPADKLAGIPSFYYNPKMDDKDLF